MFECLAPKQRLFFTYEQVPKLSNFLEVVSEQLTAHGYDIKNENAA
ncbi:hypothetical protein [Psychrobacillus sp.]|nr:hypothetical protein [Psychrobacillus sp.]